MTLDSFGLFFLKNSSATEIIIAIEITLHFAVISVHVGLYNLNDFKGPLNWNMTATQNRGRQLASKFNKDEVVKERLFNYRRPVKIRRNKFKLFIGFGKPTELRKFSFLQISIASSR